MTSPTVVVIAFAGDSLGRDLVRSMDSSHILDGLTFGLAFVSFAADRCYVAALEPVLVPDAKSLERFVLIEVKKRYGFP